MEQQAKYFWLDDFLESIERTFGFMDLSTLQPTSWRHFQPLIAKEWLAWFERIQKEAKKQNVPIEKVAKSIPSDMIREGMLFLFEDLKTARWPKEKRLEMAEFFYKMQTSVLKEDYFGLKGTNKKHSKQEVQEILKKDFVSGSPEAARELGKLYNAAYNLGAALFLDFYMGAPIENYGAYNLGNGQILVVKEKAKIEGIDTISSEALLILKQGAEIERRNTVKGQKDVIDILTILFFAPVSFKKYFELLKKYKKEEFAKELAKEIVQFNPTDSEKYLGLKFNEFNKKKKQILERLKMGR